MTWATSGGIVLIGTLIAVLLIAIGVGIWLWLLRKNAESALGVTGAGGEPAWEKIWVTIADSLKTIQSGLSDQNKRLFAFGTLLVMIGLFIMIAWSMPILVAGQAGADDPAPSATATPTPTSS